MSYTDMYSEHAIHDPLDRADIVVRSAEKCLDAALKEHEDEYSTDSTRRLGVAEKALKTLEAAVTALKLASAVAVLESDKMVAIVKQWTADKTGTIEESWNAQRVRVLAAKACVDSAITKLAESTRAERERQAKWDEICWDACTLKQALVVLAGVVETRRANGTDSGVWWDSVIVKEGRAMLAAMPEADLATKNSDTLRKILNHQAAIRAAAIRAAGLATGAAGGAGCST